MPRVLLIDDEEDMLESLRRLLHKWGYESFLASDADRALDLVAEEQPDVILSDLKMPGKDGMAILEEVKRLDPEAILVMMTGYATIESAVEAIKKGAFDYLPKPFTADQLRMVIERAERQRKLSRENANLRRQLEQVFGPDNMVGRSPAMQKVFDTVRKVAATEASILILGESGTGKELIARSLHARSLRQAQPFVPLDCAALPENLLESELFGYEKGAFTGAHRSKPGLLELANGGTIFFDEVGELSLNLQAKLLRVLQERQFRRVGGTRLIDVDLRVVAASNRDLERAVAEKFFRQDLFYRLNVISIRLPPLRERAGDIPLLAACFAERFSRRLGRPTPRFAPEAMAALERYHWPGNVRELQNVIERAISLAEGNQIEVHDLPDELRESAGRAAENIPAYGLHRLSLKEARSHLLQQFERDYLRLLLEDTGGNVSLAARHAGVDRKTIHRLLKRHGLQC